MIKAVIFDLDDTLISEKEYIKSGYRVIAKKIKNDYELSIDADKIFNDLITLMEENSKQVFNRLLQQYKLKFDNECINELINCYRNHKPRIEFYNDVEPLLNYLKNKKIKIGIISDGYMVTQENKLDVLNAYNIFDKIILTDELGRDYWKPNPKAFELMKEYFNIRYDEMIYIGDNPQKDFYIKKYYPIKTVRIIRNNSVYINEKYINDAREDLRIGNLKDLINNIDEM